MKQDNLMDAFGRVDDDMIDQVRQLREKPRRKGRGLRRALATAASVALIAGTLLTAEAANGCVSNLLAPAFGMAQTEIVNHIGVPVGVSSTDNGYTLSADAVIGDRHNVAIVYTLTRDDGQPLPEGIYFREWKTDVIEGAGGGGSFHPVYDAEHPDKVQFVESWNREKPLIGRYVTVTFSDLMVHQGNSRELLAEGTWELSYTLRYRDATIQVPTDHLEVTDEAGKEYRIDEILLSPVGIHLEGKVLNPIWEERDATEAFCADVQFRDGSVICLKNRASMGYGYTKGRKTAKFNYEAMFDEPIALDQIEALVFCGTELSVK